MLIIRSVAARLFAAVLLAWLSVVTIEPLEIHTCPMHRESATGAPHAMHSMAHHGPETPTRKNRSNQCTCPGECAATDTSAAITSARLTLPKSAEHRAPRVIARAIAVGDRSVPLLLPFANGPPSDS